MFSPLFPACPLPDMAFYFSHHLEAKVCFPQCGVDEAGEGREGNTVGTVLLFISAVTVDVLV